MSKTKLKATNKGVAKTAKEIKTEDALEAIVEDGLEVGVVTPAVGLDKPWWVDADYWRSLSEERKIELCNRS